MTLQELQELNNIINIKIKDLKNEERKNIAAYLSEHAKFKLGDRVEFVYGRNVEQCIINDASLDYDYSIKYSGRQIKKDGTASSFASNIRWSDISTIKLV